MGGCGSEQRVGGLPGDQGRWRCSQGNADDSRFEQRVGPTVVAVIRLAGRRLAFVSLGPG